MSEKPYAHMVILQLCPAYPGWRLIRGGIKDKDMWFWEDPVAAWALVKRWHSARWDDTEPPDNADQMIEPVIGYGDYMDVVTTGFDDFLGIADPNEPPNAPRFREAIDRKVAKEKPK